MFDYDFASLMNYITKIRRDLHSIPEIGLDLPQTQEYIIARLDELGIEYKKGKKDSSIVAIINGTKKGKTIALRADMDALAIREETNLAFASDNGNMHACGHDGHMAILLASAKVLSENKDCISGSVKLLFQTGEEIAAGAKILIEEGCLENPKVDYVLSTHIGNFWQDKKLNGRFLIQAGSIMASYDKIILKINGKACHAATPHLGVDPIVIASNVVLALQTIVSKDIPNSQSAVVSFGSIHGGSAYNIIPDSVVLEGTIRAFTEANRKKIIKRINEIATSIAKAYKGSVEITVVEGACPVINDSYVTNKVKSIAEEIFTKNKVLQNRVEPITVGEDVALFLRERPGCMFFFGTSDDKLYAHHNSKFDIVEENLYMPVNLMVESVLRLLDD